MAKRKRRSKKKKQKSKKAPQLTTSQHTNVPRFLIMLTIGLVALFWAFFWAGKQAGIIGGEDAAAPSPIPEESAPAF